MNDLNRIFKQIFEKTSEDLLLQSLIDSFYQIKSNKELEVGFMTRAIYEQDLRNEGRAIAKSKFQLVLKETGDINAAKKAIDDMIAAEKDDMIAGLKYVIAKQDQIIAAYKAALFQDDMIAAGKDDMIKSMKYVMTKQEQIIAALEAPLSRDDREAALAHIDEW